MKNILYIVIVLFGYNSTLAQTIVKPIESEYTTSNSGSNTYFKDINFVLDKFVGTWKYENDNTVFEVTFSKLIHESYPNNQFNDELKAEFRLTINNIVQFDTYTTFCEECIYSSGFLSATSTFRGDAINTPPNVNTFFMSYSEPSFSNTGADSDLKLIYQMDNGVEKLNWSNTYSNGYDAITNEIVNIYQTPDNMLLIKQ
ncbi:MAG: DUF6705 family protein [Flavobacteriaceae bacterium]